MTWRLTPIDRETGERWESVYWDTKEGAEWDRDDFIREADENLSALTPDGTKTTDIVDFEIVEVVEVPAWTEIRSLDSV